MLQRYKLTIAYDGTAYCGFQRQADPIPTVQATLERAAKEILCAPVIVHGSSRTDTGVHAEGQVAHMDADTPIQHERLRRAINSRLPPDILIRELIPAPPHFEASYASHKRYRYITWSASDRPIANRQRVYHYHHPVSIERMQRACTHFVGTHDFLAFQSGLNHRENTVRTIFKCDIHQRGPLIIFSVIGSGFLFRMVRNMMGTVLEAGRLTTHPRALVILPDDIREILLSRDRRKAGPCAPPQGLCLEWIRFDRPLAPFNPPDPPAAAVMSE